MNKIYRIVWNDGTQTWVAVAENSKAHGKSSTSTAQKLLMSALMTVGLVAAPTRPVRAEQAATTVIPVAGTNVNAYISANGVPVVNIANPNAKGLSHNQYTRFDIEQNGLVLNNGNIANAVRQSQLAGQVVYNPNLNAEASVILNEVTSFNRSNLAGFAEVLGRRADVILANPNGITCNGCGFINTDRVTLSTGTPNIGADGSMLGFSVNKGDVLINGLGANLNAQQIFDIVARSSKIDGPVSMPSTGELSISTGALDWSYSTRSVTGLRVGEGQTPLYAIDTSSLGGMYAGRIRMIATDAGVGVRMQGDAAASQDDFSISSAGKVEISSKLSAQRDLSITTTHTSNSADLSIAGVNASVSAGRDLSLTANQGQLSLNDARLFATQNLSLSANQINDQSALQASRGAGGSISLVSAQSATFNGGTWQAGTSLNGQFRDVSVGVNSAIFKAGANLSLITTQSMNLDSALVHAISNVLLQSKLGQLSLGVGVNQGVVSTQGSVSLKAGAGLNQAGKVIAETGNVDVLVDGLINQSGSIYAAQNVNVSDLAQAASVNLNNTGEIVSDLNLSVKAATLNNATGASLRSLGDQTIQATDLNNQGQILSAQNLDITLTNLVNTAGLVQANGILNVTGFMVDNQGIILSAGATHLNLNQLLNRAGANIQASAGLTLDAQDTQNQGSINSLQDLSITSTNLDNATGATLSSIGASNIDTTTLQNAGTVLSGGSMDLRGTTLSNSGNISSTATNNTSLNIVTDNVNNLAGGRIQSAGSFVLDSNQLNNSGVLLSNGSAQIAAINFSNTAGATLQSNDPLSLTLASLNNAGDILSQSTINIQSDLTNAPSGAALVNSSTGQIQSTGNMSVGANTLTNAGVILSQGQTDLTLSTLNNNQGANLQSQGNLTISSATLNNAGTITALATSTLQANPNQSPSTAQINNTSGGQIQSVGNLNVSTHQLTNAGVVLSQAQLNIIADQLNNQANASLQSTGNFSSVNTSLQNAGQILSQNDLSLQATSITNASTAKVLANHDLSVNAANLDNSGFVGSNNQSTLNVTNLHNLSTGTLQSIGNTIANIDQLDNEGAWLAQSDLLIQGVGSSSNFYNRGRVESQGLLKLTGVAGSAAVNIQIGSAGVFVGNTFDMSANTVTLADGAKLASLGNMNLGIQSLSFGGSLSRIVGATQGAGNVNITLSSAFSNPGVVHSGYNLNLQTPSITNTATGGISALNNLNIQASSGNVLNQGALYAGHDLSINASNQFENAAYTGTVDVVNDLSVTAASFKNAFNIKAGNNLNVSAATFVNEVAGGDTREWYTASDTGNQHYSTNSWYSFPDDYETQYWGRDWTLSQRFAGGLAPSYQPKMMAGGSFNVSNFNSASNIGGILSGSTINLSGLAGSTFTNNDLSLNSQSWKRRWEIYTHWIALGPATYDDHVLRNDTGNYIDNQYRNSSVGAGIFASNLTISNTNLVNAGSPYSSQNIEGAAQSVGALSGSNVSSVSVNGVGASGATFVTMNAYATMLNYSSLIQLSAQTVNGVTILSFGGFSLSLPSNPNGYFVSAKSSSAKYLIEANPLFQVSSDYVGSDYMASRYGYNPDSLIKRIGDANYEAYLIREQIAAMTGKVLLSAASTEAVQMQALMSNGFEQASALGFVYGQALTPAQIDSLTQDVVWMVETQVDGQSVLVPMVYLSAKTRSSLVTGAVIEADQATLDIIALKNEGGTIKGSNSLNITAQNDVKNISGDITGGNISIVSAKGSISNETLAQGSGNSVGFSTVIGKTASIAATQDLNLKAAADIQNLGAQMSSGANASLNAGNNIIFDTIQNKTTQTSSSVVSQGINSGVQNTTTTQTTQIKSGLNVAGNLSADAGNDLVLAGTDANIGQSASLSAGNDLSIIARQNTQSTTSSSSISGFGVGNALYGSTSTQSTSNASQVVGSSLNVGAGLSLDAGKTATLQAANVNAGGSIDVSAQDVNILSGANESSSSTSTQTSTILGAPSTSNGSLTVELGRNTNTNNLNYTSQSVASNLNAGAGLNIKSKNDLTIQGSNLAAESDVNLEAKNIAVLAGQDITYSKSSSESSAVGLYVSAGASNELTQNTVGGSASGTAKAGAGLATTTTTSMSESGSSTAQISSIKSNAGNITRTAQNALLDEGTQISAAGDVTQSAQTITSLAAQNTQFSNSSSSETSTQTGLFIQGSGTATAMADGSADTGGAVEVGAKTDVRAGLETQVNTIQSQSQSNRSQAIASNIQSGGNFKSSSSGNSTFVGTQVNAQGSVDVSAQDLTVLAARDTESYSSNTSNSTTRVAVSVGASAERSGFGGASSTQGIGVSNKTSASVNVNVEASVNTSQSQASGASSTAKVAQFNAGSTLNLNSAGNLNLEGTALNANSDISLNAQNLNYTAAQSTFNQSTSSSSANVNAEVNVSVLGSSSNGSLLNLEGSQTSSVNNSTVSGSLATVGALNSGGKVSINTEKNTTLVGTSIDAVSDVSINAGGNVDILAAQNTVNMSQSNNQSAAGISTTNLSFNVDNVYNKTVSNSDLATVSKLNTGGNLNISSGQDMNFVGTKLGVTGDVVLNSGGSVKFDAAKNTTYTETVNSSSNLGFGKAVAKLPGMSIQADAPTSATESASSIADQLGINNGQQFSISTGANASASASGSAGLTLGYSITQSDTALNINSDAASVTSGGNVQINAQNDLTLVGTDLNSQGNVDLSAENVNILAAQNISKTTSETVDVRLGLFASTENSANAGANTGVSAQQESSASANKDAKSVSASASGSASANASAGAEVSASSNNTVDFAKVTVNKNETYDLTNKGAKIQSGGTLSINAQNKLQSVGSSLQAENDVNLSAQNMSFTAAQDISYSKSSSSVTTVGLYADVSGGAKADASASGSASAEASGGNSAYVPGAKAGASAGAEASVGASANGKAGIGLQVKNNTETIEQGSSTAVVSSIISNSGSINRTANKTILDVGTNIEAAQDLNQSAQTITSLAAQNTSFVSTTSEETVARVGLYAEGNAEAKASGQANVDANAQAQLGASGSAEAGASGSASAGADGKVGVETTVDYTKKTDSLVNTQAVVSNIKVGGNLNSQSAQKTTLVGTTISVGNDVNLSAGSLDIQAAKDTEIHSTSEQTASARLAMFVGASASAEASGSASAADGASNKAGTEAGLNVGAEFSLSYGQSNQTDKSSTAVVANIQAGNSINLNSSGAVTLEGTALNAGQDVNIDAQSLDYKAAQNTASSESSALQVDVSGGGQVSIIGNDTKFNAEASFSNDNAQSSSTEAVVGSVGAGGSFNVRTTQDTRFEGTQIDTGADTNISAGGSVSFDAAQSTEQSSSNSASVSFSMDTKEKSVNASASVGVASASASNATVAKVNTGGSLNISAQKDVNLVGTELNAGQDAQIAAGENVNFTAAQNTAQSQSVSVDANFGTGTSSEDNKTEKTTTTTKNSSMGVNVSVENSSEKTALTGSLNAGNNFTIVAGKNANFVGTDLSAGNSAQIAAGNDVNFTAAESSSQSTSVGVGLSGSMSSESTAATPDEAPTANATTPASNASNINATANAAKKPDTSKEMELGFNVGVASSTTQKGATIKTGSGGVSIQSGNNINLQGVVVETQGSADLSAGGSINKTDAISTSSVVGVGANFSFETSKTNPEEDATVKDTTATTATATATSEPAKASTDATASKTGEAANTATDAKNSATADTREKESNAVGEITDLTVTNESTSSATTIVAAGGSTERTGVVNANPQISMNLRPSMSSDGSQKVLLPIPPVLPTGQTVKLSDASGQALPDWISLDSKTGTLVGIPPAGFTGQLNVVIAIPQMDGSVKNIAVQFGQ